MAGGNALAAAPSPGINQQINFQGRLLTAAGAVIADGSYNMEFKIYKNGDGLAAGDTTCTITDCQSTTGTLLWTEDRINQAAHGVTVKNGYFSISLGSVTSLSGIDLNQPVLWLSINVAGGANATSATCTPFSSCTPDGEMLPMKRLSSAVYAFNSNQLGGLTSAGFIQNVAPTSTAQNANFNVLNGSGSTSTATAELQQVASATAPVLILKGGATPGSGADLLQLQNSSGTLDRFDSSGNLYMASGTSIDTNASSGTLTIGGVGTTSNATTINLGNNAGSTAQTINVAASTAANTVNIANGAITSGTETVNVATGSSGSGSDTVTVGSLNGTSTTTINGGSGNINLTTNQSGAGLVVKSVTNNSANLLRIQNAAGTSFLTADSTKNQITTQDLSVGNLPSTATTAGRIFSDNFESNNFNLWNGGSTISGSSTQVVAYGSAHTGNFAASFSPSSGNDHVNQTIPTTSTPIYYRAYVYVVSATTALKLFGASDGTVYYEVQVATNGNLSFNNNGTATTVGLNMSFNAWHEVVLALSPGAGSGSATIYLDGVAGTAVTAQTINNLTQLVAGTHSTTQTGSFMIDDITVDGNVLPGDSASLLVGDSLHVDGSASFGGEALFQNNTNSTTALQVQNAAGYNVLSVDTASNSNQGQVVLGASSHNNGTLLFNNSGGSAQVGLAVTSSNTNSYTLDLPIAAPSTSQCLQSGASTATQLIFGSCGSGSGVTTVGTFSGSSQTNGASIAASTITFGPADTTNPGMVTASTTQQVFGGPKAFKTPTNTTTAFEIQSSSGASGILLNADTTNMRLGVNATYTLMTVPSSLTSLPVTGGSLTAGAYKYEVTAIDSAGGETTVSNEVTGTTSGSNLTNQLAWTAVSGASGYKIYRTASGGASGTEKYLTAVLTNGYNDDGSITLGTAVAPGSNSAYTSSNVSNSSLAVSVGGNGSPTGQLYVSGSVPSAALATVQTGNDSEGVYVQGRYAYVVNGVSNAMKIYDVSNPAAPVLMGTDSGFGSTPQNVYVQGRYAYVADNASGRMYVINVSDPANPTNTGNVIVNIGAHLRGIYVQGRYAYVTDEIDATLVIIDISNPASPTIVGSVGVGTDPTSVFVAGKFAYVTDPSGGTVYRVDVSNPASPGTPGNVLSSRASNIYVQGRYAYTINSSSSTLDIIDLNTGIDVGSVSTGTSPSDISVQGRYVYVISQSAGTLQTFDVSNPTKPVAVGSAVSTTANPNSLFVVGRYAYAVSGTSTTGTLQTFDLGGGYVQQLEAGGLETGTLQADSNASINGDLSLQGGITAGGSLNVGGAAEIAGGLTIGASDTTGVLLVLDTNTSATEPTEVDGGMYYNSNSGQFRCGQAGAWVSCIAMNNASTANQTATTTTPAYLTGSAIKVPGAGLHAGAQFIWRFVMTKTASGTATPSFIVKYGTNGTTADTSEITFTGPAETAAVDTAYVTINVTVRSVSATGTWVGSVLMLHNNSASGFISALPNMFVAQSVTGTFNDTTSGAIVGLTVTAGTSNTFTIQQVQAEALGL